MIRIEAYRSGHLFAELDDDSRCFAWVDFKPNRTYIGVPSTTPVWRAARYLRKIRKIDRLVSSYASVEASYRKGL
jgi:hypothetical protein